jgi:glycosyltransferase involved in cell wall biosynthesis
MRIALDLTPLMPRQTGVDRFMLNLVRGLSRVDPENGYLVFVNHGDEPRLPELDPARWAVVSVSGNSRGRRLWFQHVELLPRLERAGVDVLHSLSFLAPLRASRVRQVLSVHDMTFFTHPRVHNLLHRSRPFRWLVLQSIRRADRIIVPAEAVRRDVLSLCTERTAAEVDVVEYGLDPCFRPESPTTRPANGAPNLPTGYLLFVGTLEPRKNMHLILEAYRRLLQDGLDRHLVLVGQWGWEMDTVRRQLDDPIFAGRVHVTGYVPDQELVGIYAGAELLLYPSIAEGFGFPPLEAMAMGVPVIVSTTSVLRELYHEAAVTVEPTDCAGLIAAIRHLMEDRKAYEERRRLGLALAQQFTWERAAQKTLAAYRAALK